MNVSAAEVLGAEMWVYWEGAGLEGAVPRLLQLGRMAKLRTI